MISSIPEQIKAIQEESIQENNENFTLYRRGSEAVLKAFFQSSTLPGTAWRMADLDLSSWPLGINDEVIYPQISASIEITKNSDLAILRNASTKAFTQQDLTYDVVNRGDDFGILERAGYLKSLNEENYISKKEYITSLIKLCDWLFSIIDMLDEKSTERTKKLYKMIRSNPDFYSCFILAGLYRFRKEKLKLMADFFLPKFFFTTIFFAIIKLS